MRLLSLRSFVLVILVLSATFLFAQSQATTGVIEGTVTDATGGALPGVTVTDAATPATNYEQAQVTDSRGPLPRRAAAARALRGDGHAGGLRHRRS